LNRKRLLFAPNVDIPDSHRIGGSIDRHDGARKSRSQIVSDDLDVVHLLTTIMHGALA
jgi:hypothetical protein